MYCIRFRPGSGHESWTRVVKTLPEVVKTIESIKKNYKARSIQVFFNANEVSNLFFGASETPLYIKYEKYLTKQI